MVLPLRPPTPQTLTSEVLDALPSAEEYSQYGISLVGLEAFLEEHQNDITAGVTSVSDVCHTLIMPATIPAGWTDEPLIIDGVKRHYHHTYTSSANTQDTTTVDRASHRPTADKAANPGTANAVSVRGGRQTVTGDVPGGTRSYCSMLAADPSKRHYVGKPTVYFCYARLFCFRNALAALRLYVDSLPPDNPPPFFWFDVFCADQHVMMGLPSPPPEAWFSTVLTQVVTQIGQSLMMLSPWDTKKDPLTRAWCLWELYTTRRQGAFFDVCLGPAEWEAFEAAVVGDHAKVLSMAQVDISAAKSSRPEELDAILAAVQTCESRFQGFNHKCELELRAWLVAALWKTVERIAMRPAGQGGGARMTAKMADQAGSLLVQLGEGDGAKQLFESAIEGYEEAGDDPGILRARGRLVDMYLQQGDLPSARDVLQLIVALRKKRDGVTSAKYLAARMMLAQVLMDIGDLEQARLVFEDVLQIRTDALGDKHEQTIAARQALARLVQLQKDNERQEKRANESFLENRRSGTKMTHVVKASTKLIREEFDAWLKRIQVNGLALHEAPPGLRMDRKLVLEAVAQNGAALQYAHADLQEDRRVVVTAIAQSPAALQHAAERWRADRQVVLKAVAQNGSALNFASKELKADREVVRTAVETSSRALAYASAECKGDRELVIAAVAIGGSSLGYASSALKADKEVVLAAVMASGSALQFAAAELRMDKDVVLAAVSTAGEDALAFASKSLQRDVDVLAACDSAVDARARQMHVEIVGSDDEDDEDASVGGGGGDDCIDDDGQNEEHEIVATPEQHQESANEDVEVALVAN
eukprot:COSAG01_NODE_1227_length_11135_cov_33.369337_3_plen_817_part_00